MHGGFPGIESPELICLGLPDKQSFCPKSGLCLCFSRWGEDRRKQLAGRKFDPRVGAGRLSLPLEWGEGWGRGGAEPVELEILLRAGRRGRMKALLGSRALMAPCNPQRAADVTEGAARGGRSDLLAYCLSRRECCPADTFLLGPIPTSRSARWWQPTGQAAVEALPRGSDRTALWNPPVNPVNIGVCSWFLAPCQGLGLWRSSEGSRRYW